LAPLPGHTFGMREIIKRHKLKFGLTTLVLLPVVVLVLWAALTLNITYSGGDRAGYIQKLSKRGWLCKTWEGELVMTPVPGAAPEKFMFSVRSDSLAGEMNKMLGKQVALTYAQHKYVPTSCFGDTEYFVTSARLVQ
jgi:hypothetical protein